MKGHISYKWNTDLAAILAAIILGENMYKDVIFIVHTVKRPKLELGSYYFTLDRLQPLTACFEAWLKCWLWSLGKKSVSLSMAHLSAEANETTK